MKRLIKRALAILLGLALFLYLDTAMGWWPATDIIAHVIIDAPNKGRTSDQLHPPPTPAGARTLNVPIDGGRISFSLWLFDPVNAPPSATVLVFHGIRDSKRSMAGMGRYLAQLGYRAVLVDLPGEGSSTGTYLTYGFNESRDLSKLIDQLQEKQLIAGPIGIYGPSYGGATAIQLAAIDLRIRTVVAAGAFADCREEVHAFAADGFYSRWVPAAEMDRALTRAGQIAGFDPAEAAPDKAIARTRIPILLIHGTADTTVPEAQARANYAAGAGHTELRLIPGANHNTVFHGEGGRTIALAMAAWFKNHLAAPPHTAAQPGV